MLKWIDNFEGYMLPGYVNPSSPIAFNYRVWGGLNNFYFDEVVSVPEPRFTVRTTTENKSALTYPLEEALAAGPAFLGSRIINYPTASDLSPNRGHFGIAHVSGSTFNGVLVSIGVININELSINWVDQGIVTGQIVTLPQNVFGTSDYLEFKVEQKSSGLGELAIWLNNRVVFQEQCVPDSFIPAEELQWIVNGNIECASIGSVASYVQTGLTGTAASPAHLNITDFYVVDTTPGINTDRLGRIRVTGRPPSGDAGPNEWTPYPGATEASNAEIVASVPPSTSKYVSATAEVQTEMYGALAFPALGGEQVVGMMTRLVANKADPLGTDVKPLIRSGSVTGEGAITPLGSTLTYINTVFETNPATGNRWSAAEANNSRFGFVSETAE